MDFELTNHQRKYLGLDEVQSKWDRVHLKAGPYQPESILYYEGNVIKKQIISTDDRYFEWPVNLATRDRMYLLPKTAKGKEKKLTAATLEKYEPDGVAFEWRSNGRIYICNHRTQIDYYNNFLEAERTLNYSELENWLDQYIKDSPSTYLSEIEQFRNAKRQNVRYKPGDFFAFKVNRFEYGFGRILIDINKLRRKSRIPKPHGLHSIFGPPLLIKIYAYISDSPDMDVHELSAMPSLPSDYIMDNQIFYGQNPIIGNLPLEESDFDFPVSYGRSTDFTRGVTFLRWGFIHLELPIAKYSKYVYKETFRVGDHNPYGYYSNGFYHRYSAKDIRKTIENGGYDYSGEYDKLKWDLRNPINERVRREIFQAFDLDPDKSYFDNCRILGVEPIIRL